MSDATPHHPDRRYQVFISSTFADLKDERKAALEGVYEAGHIPIALERFSAANESDLQTIKRAMEDCQVYILILGHRYGQIVPGETFSFTELEYDLAQELELLTLTFVLDEKLSEERRTTLNPKVARDVEDLRNYGKLADFHSKIEKFKQFGNSGFVVGERGFGPATALDTVDAPILKPSAFGRGWDLGACVNGGVEGRAGDAPLPPKWLITMGLRQKNRFNECKACGCEPASNHMSGFGFSATDSDSGRRAHGSHERARSARKGRKKHVSVLPRPNRSPWIVVEQNHNGIGKLMVPAFQIYANMNVINDL